MALKDQLLPRQAQSNLPEEDGDEGNELNEKSEEQLGSLASQLLPEEFETQIESLPPTPTPSTSTTDEPRTIVANRSRKRTNHLDALVSIEKEKIEYLRKRSSTHAENAAPDEDKAFLESLLPHVKKIENCDKLCFRNEVQNLVQTYAYKQPPQQQGFETFTRRYDDNGSVQYHY